MVCDEDIKNWFLENFGFIPDKKEFPTFWEDVKRYLQFLEDAENCDFLIILPDGRYVFEKVGGS